ncbi:MAG: hypothetical protein R3236_07995, partial [Phycisphaeraceae bacterium]|nr:hypothetical protein [Phycisphaeraceae bacterium]
MKSLYPTIWTATALVAFAGPLQAQELELLGRTVVRFDFEGRSGDGRSMNLWSRSRRPATRPTHATGAEEGYLGFHRHTLIRLAEPGHGGRGHSLMLKLKGGSAAVQLARGVVAAIPQTLYRIHGRIRADKGQDPARRRQGQPMVARARIAAVFYSSKKQDVLHDTWSFSPLVSDRGVEGEAPDPQRTWHPVHFDLPPAPAEADWILLRLELLQPAVYEPSPLNGGDPVDQHIPRPQDLHAAAWFDDIRIDRQPRLELRTQDPVNLIRGEVPTLHVRAVDPVKAAKKQVLIEVLDLNGRVVRAQRRTDGPVLEAVQRRPIGDSEPSQWSWPILADPNDPEKTALPYGFFTARLTVIADGRPVSTTRMAFGHLPPASADSTADRFAIVAEDLSESQRRLLEPLMKRLPKQVLVINAWSADTTERQLRSRSWGGPLSRLMLKGHRMELSLPEVPRFLAERIGSDTDMVLAMFEADPSQWEPALGLLLSRYGHRVNRWHVGRADVRPEDPAGPTNPDLAYRRIASSLNRYVAAPELVLPASAQQPIQMPADLHHLRVRVPLGVRPARLPEAAGQWPAKAQITTLLQTYPAKGPLRIHPADRATDLALRMVWTKVAKAKHPSIRGMAIERPWKHRIDPSGNERIEPDPLLLVWDNLTNRLGGRRVVGSLRLGAGRWGYLMEDASGRGTLVAWAQGTDEPTLSMQLGPRPVAMDIWGNRRDFSGRPYLRTVLGVNHVRLGPSPLFIESIDLPLMKLRTSFALTP